jgi:NNP family nitrate/nitrite transporter-like MFS transporter
LRASFAGDAKSATAAFWVFLGFYVICAVVTWAMFLRMRLAAPITGRVRGPAVAVGAR